MTECDLVVKGNVGGVERGWVLEGSTFRDDLGNFGITDATLRAIATSDGPLTYTAVPPGSGRRAGIDRDDDLLTDGVETNTGVFVSPHDTGTDPARSDTDGDGIDDGREVIQGSDPTDPLSHFAVPSMGPGGQLLLALLMAGAAVGAMRPWRPQRTSKG